MGSRVRPLRAHSAPLFSEWPLPGGRGYFLHQTGLDKARRRQGFPGKQDGARHRANAQAPVALSPSPPIPQHPCSGPCLQETRDLHWGLADHQQRCPCTDRVSRRKAIVPQACARLFHHCRLHIGGWRAWPGPPTLQRGKCTPQVVSSKCRKCQWPVKSQATHLGVQVGLRKGRMRLWLGSWFPTCAGHNPPAS